MSENFTPIIELPKSGLRVIEGVLEKRSKQGILVARHQLSKIRDIKVVKTIDPISRAVLIICLISSLAARYYIPSPAINWIVCIFLWLAALFSFAILYKYQIRLTLEKDKIFYDALDILDEIYGFTASLKEIIELGATEKPAEKETENIEKSGVHLNHDL